jgi:hypothetical protein
MSLTRALLLSLALHHLSSFCWVAEDHCCAPRHGAEAKGAGALPTTPQGGAHLPRRKRSAMLQRNGSRQSILLGRSGTAVRPVAPAGNSSNPAPVVFRRADRLRPSLQMLAAIPIRSERRRQSISPIALAPPPVEPADAVSVEGLQQYRLESGPRGSAGSSAVPLAVDGRDVEGVVIVDRLHMCCREAHRPGTSTGSKGSSGNAALDPRRHWR